MLVPYRTLLSVARRPSIAKASLESYDQSQRRYVGKRSETNKSQSGPEDQGDAPEAEPAPEEPEEDDDLDDPEEDELA